MRRRAYRKDFNRKRAQQEESFIIQAKLLSKLGKEINQFKDAISNVQEGLLNHPDSEALGVDYALEQIARELGRVQANAIRMFGSLQYSNFPSSKMAIKDIYYAAKNIFKILATLSALGFTLGYGGSAVWDKRKKKKNLQKMVKLIEQYRQLMYNSYEKGYLPKVDQFVTNPDIAAKDKAFIQSIADSFSPSSNLKRLIEQLNRSVYLMTK
jgi:hypothetical protein